MDSIAEVAAAAVGSLLKEGPLSEGKLQFAWRLAVGPAIERVSSVSMGPGGVVVVTVSDARWKKEIARSRETIHRRLAELLGNEAVKRLSIAQSPDRQIARSPNE